MKRGDVVRYVDGANQERLAVLLADLPAPGASADLQAIDQLPDRLDALETQVTTLLGTPDLRGKVLGVPSSRRAGGPPYWVPL